MQLFIACNGPPLLDVSQKRMDLGIREILSSLSLEQMSFHFFDELFEPDNARLYDRCHLQLLVKSTYLMLALYKSVPYLLFFDLGIESLKVFWPSKM